MSTTGPLIALAAKLPADLLDALGERYRFVDLNGALEIEALRNVEVMVTTAVRGVSAGDIERLPELKLVLSQGVGRDRIDFSAARSRGIAVSVTPNVVMTDDVADFAIGLMYAAARLIPQADRFVRDGLWGTDRMRSSVRVHQKRLGIVGMGRIGRALALRATGVGMSVSYTSRNVVLDVPYLFEPDIIHLARSSDFLILCCPGGEATRHLCGPGAIDALGPKGILVNVSRGSVVDEEALLSALTHGRLRGAALDVFSTEPRLDPRFISLSNVILTPHSATITEEARSGVIACMLEDAGNYFEGKPLRHIAVE